MCHFRLKALEVRLPANIYVCSDHFQPSDFLPSSTLSTVMQSRFGYGPKKSGKELRPGACPYLATAASADLLPSQAEPPPMEVT